MSYTPTTWETGDVIDAAGLNKMEDGIAAAGPLVVTANAETGALDHTWQEINDAPFAVVTYSEAEGRWQYPVLRTEIKGQGEYSIIAMVISEHNETYTLGAFVMATATSADGYPVIVDEGDSQS